MSKMIPNSTQVPNYIFDELFPLLTVQEFAVLMYITRRTYGFQKDRDQISLSQFTDGIMRKSGEALDKGTPMSKPTVLKALHSLIAFNIVEVSALSISLPIQKRRATEYQLNLDDDEIDFAALIQRKEYKSELGKQSYKKRH